MTLTDLSIVTRSYLFVPGDRPERFARALSSGSDAVIADLEDAVSLEAKNRARDAVADALAAGDQLLVRVNAADTPWFEDDLAMCREQGAAAVVIPKAEGADLLHAVAGKLGSSTPLLPLIETARGVHGMQEIAACGSVQRLLFGSIDLQLDLGMDGEEELNVFRAQLVLASRLANIAAPVDGVTAALDDEALLVNETVRARKLGFGGKLCIHPRQIKTVNDCFSPGEEEVAWAKRVVEAAQQASGAAVALDGKMLDRPVIARAEKLLRLSELIAGKAGS